MTISLRIGRLISTCAPLMCVSSLLVGAGPAHAQHESRPNIIFILTDDQRWDAVGYGGNKIIHTPEMDRLAAEGTSFVNAFSTTPICAASRASFLTGLYERTHGYTFQVENVRDEHIRQSYPRFLRENGYYTGFIGKLGVNGVPVEKYEVYDRNTKFKDARGYYYKALNGDTVHLTRYTGARAMDFIDSVSNDRPFCLSISFSAPHGHDPSEDQYFWDPDVDQLYRDVVIEEPALGDDHYFERLPTIVKEGFNRTRWHWRFDTPEKYQRSVKGYYRMISEIDREIGRIREQLKKKNLDRNTIIIFASDNGYFLGDRQLADKWLMYEPSIRIPMVVYDPRVKSGHTVSDMVLNIDVPSTILDFAGITPPGDWQGRSLVPAVMGTRITDQRRDIFVEHLWETVNIPPSEGVRTERWKYFRYINDRSIEELYDLQSDPDEMHNLVLDRKYRHVLNTLRKRTDAYVNEYGDVMAGTPQSLEVDFQPNAPSLPNYVWRLPKHAESERGYQVLVSSSRRLIDLNIGDVWNSGRVLGEHGSNVRHSGTPLKPHTKYFWKVRIWDHDNRMTEYSDTGRFATP